MRRSSAGRFVSRGISVGSVAMVVACGALVGIDGYTIGECKGGVCVPDAGESDALAEDDSGAIAPDDSGVACPGKPLPPAIRIGPPGNTFCIDTTEVSNAAYDAFLAAKVDPKGQPPECAWNASFDRDRPEEDDGGVPEKPVVGVDWCDARAYCAWAGKYLCGKVEDGKKTGPVTLEGLSDYTSHQWMLACSAEARLRYPYGGLYDPAKCNLVDYDAGRALPVGTVPGCVGGYQGIHDLVGNVWEWFDGPCSADGALEVDGGDGGPASDGCLLKGGSFLDNGAPFDCRLEATNIRRDLRQYNVGFRCCSD
ncbi:MAG: formylglycine-generating enzyme family protein [Labilithrix sp.]|nr:formylglycine-generating enzyme family protein [Labilithrix sp.]